MQRPSQRSRRPLVVLAAAAAALIALSGCDHYITPGGATGGRAHRDTPTPTPTLVAVQDAPAPAPSPTETVVPGGSTGGAAEAIDARCLEAYPWLTERAYEREVELRPDFWPFAPDFAAYCYWVRDDGSSGTAYYATDAGIVRAEVYRTYETAFAGRGQHGRVDSDNGELLTGVYPPAHSYYIQFDNPNRYEINFAIDGDYADE